MLSLTLEVFQKNLVMTNEYIQRKKKLMFMCKSMLKIKYIDNTYNNLQSLEGSGNLCLKVIPFF